MHRIVIHGFDQLGKRLADAVSDQPDMVVAAVVDRHPAHRALAAKLGFRALPAEEALPEADALIAGPGRLVPSPLPVVYRPGAGRGEVALFNTRKLPASERTTEGPVAVRLPSPDAIVLARLVRAMGGPGEWRGLGCTSAGCHENAVRPGKAPDRLEPIFSSGSHGMARYLGLSSSGFAFHRVHVPCGGSRIYFIHLEGHRETNLDRLVADLDAAPRCLLGRAGEGFSNTASISEYFRDLGRSRGDHHEVFIWRESMTTEGHHAYLIAEADPVAVVVPETIDALRVVTGAIKERFREKGAHL